MSASKFLRILGVTATLQMSGLAQANDIWRSTDAAISQHQATIWSCGSVPNEGRSEVAFRQRIIAIARSAARGGLEGAQRSGCKPWTYIKNGPGHSTSVYEKLGSPIFSANGSAFIPTYLVEANAQATGYNFGAVVVLSKATQTRPPALIPYSRPKGATLDEVMSAREKVGLRPLLKLADVQFPATIRSRDAATQFARMSYPGITDPVGGYFICPSRAVTSSILDTARNLPAMGQSDAILGKIRRKCRAGLSILRTVNAWDMVRDKENDFEGAWFAVTAVANGKPVEVLSTWYIVE